MRFSDSVGAADGTGAAVTEEPETWMPGLAGFLVDGIVNIWSRIGVFDLDGDCIDFALGARLSGSWFMRRSRFERSSFAMDGLMIGRVVKNFIFGWGGRD